MIPKTAVFGNCSVSLNPELVEGSKAVFSFKHNRSLSLSKAVSSMSSASTGSAFDLL